MNLESFLQKPTVILRMVSCFCAMLIFSCILDKGYDTRGVCEYHKHQGACDFTVGVSIIAFFVAILYILLEYYWDQIQNTVTRKYVVFGDMSFSAFWSFLFFIAFCYTADMWRKTDATALSGHTKSNLQAGIAFSLISLFLWALQGWLAYKQMQEIQNNAFDFGASHDSNPNPYSSTYSESQAFPPRTENADSYQSPYTS